MGIITAPTTRTRIKVVYTEDPDVDAKTKGARGWIRYQEATVREGATVLEVVPLNRDQRSAANDAGGLHQMQQARVESALKSVNGDESPAALASFVESPDSEEVEMDSAIYTLGVFVKCLTGAEDPQEEQGRLFRAYDRIDAARDRVREDVEA